MGTKDDTMRLTVFGARGSCPISGPGYNEFGGNTSCYMVEAAGHTILLDGGTGIMNAPVDFPDTPAILLSHLHADHIAGLGMYGRLSKKGQTTDIYVPAIDDQEAHDLVALYYAPPLWPVQFDTYGGDVAFHATPKSFRIGEVEVETRQGSHPGGCLLIKVSYGQKSLVYATDFEPTVDAVARLIDLARDTDLLLYDGQYEEGADYEVHRGFGHSTPQGGLSIQKRAGAKQLLIVHHDPHATDQMLAEREDRLFDSAAQFAREGMVIEL